MRPLDIDFNWRSRSEARSIGVVMLVLAVMGLAIETWVWLDFHGQEALWQAKRQRLDRVMQARQARATPERQERLLAELKFANHVIDKLDLPWDALFSAIESAGGEHVALLGIEPDVELHKVRVAGEAKDSTALLGYWRNLKQAPALKGIYLSGHQVNTQDPQHPVRFTLEADWADVPAPRNGGLAVESSVSRQNMAVGEAKP